MEGETSKENNYMEKQARIIRRREKQARRIRRREKQGRRIIWREKLDLA